MKTAVGRVPHAPLVSRASLVAQRCDGVAQLRRHRSVAAAHLLHLPQPLREVRLARGERGVLRRQQRELRRVLSARGALLLLLRHLLREPLARHRRVLELVAHAGTEVDLVRVTARASGVSRWLGLGLGFGFGWFWVWVVLGSGLGMGLDLALESRRSTAEKSEGL